MTTGNIKEQTAREQIEIFTQAIERLVHVRAELASGKLPTEEKAREAMDSSCRAFGCAFDLVQFYRAGAPS